MTAIIFVAPRLARRQSCDNPMQIVVTFDGYIWHDGVQLLLRPMVRRLLALFLTRAGQLVSHDDIADYWWGEDDGGGPEDVRGHIAVYMVDCRRLAVRFGLKITTEWGRGYRMASA